MRYGAGVFRRLLHELDDNAPFTFDGIPLWLAECGAVCVPLERLNSHPTGGPHATRVSGNPKEEWNDRRLAPA